MVERASQIAEIDLIMRQIGWYAQKRSTHTLAHPEIDITLPQMITLFAIHDSGTCRMSTLAEVTQQSAGTLTGIVDRLIDDGLVTRVRNISDRRVVEVMLTPEGTRRLQLVVDARREDMNQVLEHFSEDDIELLGRMLKRLLDELHRSETSDLSREVEA